MLRWGKPSLTSVLTPEHMEVCYKLKLADHLAWYDYYLTTPEGASLRSSAPIDRLRRWWYSLRVILPPSRHALGQRTLEANGEGVRESSPKFSFSTAWSDMGLVAVTPAHLFLAHISMNAHIVPLKFFKSDAERQSFVSFARSHVRVK